MGALTTISNRKRPDSDFYSPVSKKSKIFPSMPQTPDRIPNSKSIISRLCGYPDVTRQINREVHAPQRVDRFGYSARRDASSEKMGNYYSAMKCALQSLRFYRGVKEVIDVDDEGVRGESVTVSSSVEVVEVVEDGVEEEDRLKEREKEEIFAKYRELDGKVGVEENPSSSLAVGASRLTDGKMLDSLSSGRQVEVWDVDAGVSVHKKLHEDANKRDDKLSRLSSQISLTEAMVARFQMVLSPKKQADFREPFVPLLKDEENEVARALSNAFRRKVLVTHENSNIQITGEMLQCLRPGAWLNDEVINVYLELLKEREKREPKKFLKCHFFSTFFYKKLISGRTGYDYKSVRRWTTQRKLGYCLLECDKIFVPVHKEIHWCLAVINKKDGKFQYLDSLGGVDKQVMKVLAQYFVDEVKDKSGLDFDITSWKQEYVKDLPNQENGFDCGMFMIKYADFYSRDIGLRFKQEHMPYFRKRTAKEILRLRAD